MGLIHARLVLVHVKGRREILRRLAATLAPGGALVVEEVVRGLVTYSTIGRRAR